MMYAVYILIMMSWQGEYGYIISSVELTSYNKCKESEKELHEIYDKESGRNKNWFITACVQK